MYMKSSPFLHKKCFTEAIYGLSIIQRGTRPHASVHSKRKLDCIRSRWHKNLIKTKAYTVLWGWYIILRLQHYVLSQSCFSRRWCYSCQPSCLILLFAQVSLSFLSCTNCCLPNILLLLVLLVPHAQLYHHLPITVTILIFLVLIVLDWSWLSITNLIGQNQFFCEHYNVWGRI